MRGAIPGGPAARDRNRALDGEKDGIRSMKSIRGDTAVAHLRSEVDRYAMLKSKPRDY
ncbi:hypothetical protein AB4Z10_15680 [Bosea sp. RAF48]|uniref:hypothetical protein n=1 Tax=Bosea sp. RAF48 TaxID=3237480 RepID=UPI003F924BF8